MPSKGLKRKNCEIAYELYLEASRREQEKQVRAVTEAITNIDRANDPYTQPKSWKRGIYEEVSFAPPHIVVKFARMVDAAFAPGQPCYDHEEEELKRLLVEEIAGEVKPSRLDRAINELRPDSERLSENELKQRDAGWLYERLYTRFKLLGCFSDSRRHCTDGGIADGGIVVPSPDLWFHWTKLRPLIGFMVEKNMIRPLPISPEMADEYPSDSEWDYDTSLGSDEDVLFLAKKRLEEETLRKEKLERCDDDL